MLDNETVGKRSLIGWIECACRHRSGQKAAQTLSGFSSSCRSSRARTPASGSATAGPPPAAGRPAGVGLLAAGAPRRRQRAGAEAQRAWQQWRGSRAEAGAGEGAPSRSASSLRRVSSTCHAPCLPTHARGMSSTTTRPFPDSCVQHLRCAEPPFHQSRGSEAAGAVGPGGRCPSARRSRGAASRRRRRQPGAAVGRRASDGRRRPLSPRTARRLRGGLFHWRGGARRRAARLEVCLTVPSILR